MKYSGATFDQKTFAKPVGFAMSLLNDRLTGRTHLGKPFRNFYDLSKRMRELKEDPSVEADRFINSAVETLVSSLDTIFTSKTIEDPKALREDLMSCGVAAMKGFDVANQRREVAPEEALHDASLTIKVALIASSLKETITKKFQLDASSVPSYERIAARLNRKVDTETASRFHNMATGKIVETFVKSDLVVGAVDEFVYGKRKAGSKGPLRKKGQETLKKMVVRTGGSAIIMEGGIKLKTLPRNKAKIAAQALLLNLIYSAYESSRMTKIQGLITTDGKPYDPVENPGVWIHSFPPTKFKTGRIWLDENENRLYTIVDGQKIGVYDTNTFETKCEMDIGGKITIMGTAGNLDDSGHCMLLASKSGRIISYNVDTKERSIGHYPSDVPVLCIKTDNFSGMMYAAYADGMVKAWSLDLKDVMFSQRFKKAVRCMATDERYGFKGIEPADTLVLGFQDGTVKAFNITKQNGMTETLSIEGAHKKPIVHVAVSEGEIFTSDGVSIRVWDSGTSTRVKTLKNVHEGIEAIAATKNHLITAGKDRGVKIFDVENWRMVKAIGTTGSVQSIVPDRNGDFYTVERGHIRFWRLDGLLYGEDEKSKMFDRSLDLDASTRNIRNLADINLEDDDVPPPPSDDIHEVLRTPVYRKAFMSFLKEKHAEENLMFWTDVQRYKALYGVAAERACSRAGKRIIAYYVKDGSHYEINLSGQLRAATVDLEDFNEKTFNSAQDEVVSLLQDNFFQDFKRNFMNNQAELGENQRIEDAL